MPVQLSVFAAQSQINRDANCQPWPALSFFHHFHLFPNRLLHTVLWFSHFYIYLGYMFPHTSPPTFISLRLSPFLPIYLFFHYSSWMIFSLPLLHELIFYCNIFPIVCIVLKGAYTCCDSKWNKTIVKNTSLLRTQQRTRKESSSLCWCQV